MAFTASANGFFLDDIIRDIYTGDDEKHFRGALEGLLNTLDKIVFPSVDKDTMATGIGPLGSMTQEDCRQVMQIINTICNEEDKVQGMFLMFNMMVLLRSFNSYILMHVPINMVEFVNMFLEYVKCRCEDFLEGRGPCVRKSMANINGFVNELCQVWITRDEGTIKSTINSPDRNKHHAK